MRVRASRRIPRRARGAACDLLQLTTAGCLSQKRKVRGGGGGGGDGALM